ncbi:uncharacterized protein LOC128863624 [Anastrepha ludens]|uniref:uncharacterized protein LOC128863624 n=1 Tax=Anastrepha ludens TaxID=28586 RepID=UPI0023B0E391|nr:uncharacterized protein LOC128863624 [Anastrepha ludens]
MAKISVLLVLGVCLALQLATAFPHQKPSTAIQEDDIKLKDLQITDESKSTETDFRTLLRPVASDILATIIDFPTLLIRETPTFLQDLLVELNALPEKNDYVKELIPRLTQLLDRIEKLDLDDDSISGLGQKEIILKEITKLYEDFVDVAQIEDESSETTVVKKLFDKLDWDRLIERAENSMKQAVETYTKVFEDFWNSLSEAQREEHPDMSDWYERFQAKETIQEKYRAFVEFLQILKNTLIKDTN